MKKILLCLLLMLSLVGCSGQPTNSEDETIHIYTRDASSGTREAFEKGIGIESDELTSQSSEVASNGDMATRISQDKNGIGYVSLSTDLEANNLKALSFEGASASIETVLDGSYSLQRPFNYVLRAEDDFLSDDLKQLSLAFIDYISNSLEGLSVIEANGGIVDYTNAKSWDEIKVKYPVLDQDNSSLTIRVGGSTSVEHCIKAALESFKALAGNVNFTMNQSGSSDAALRTVGSEKDGPNAIEIGFASRNFKEEEDLSSSLLNGTFCLDAVVAVVNKDNPLNDVSKEQLKQIFTGAITSFSALD